MNFPDFMNGLSFPDPTLLSKMQELVDNELPDGWGFQLNPPPRRIILDSGEGWFVTITKDETKTRGSITHTGVITGHDGRVHTLDELTDILTGLGSFFAFASGYHCFPTVTIGYGYGGKPMWGRAARFPYARSKPLNWFINSHDVPLGGYIEGLFPKFWTKWKVKSREISEAIDLYIRSATSSENGNPVGAIGESYAGLEALSSLIRGKTIIGRSAEAIDAVLKQKGIPRRCLKELNLPVFERLGNMLNDDSIRGVFLLSKMRNYGPHPLKMGTPADIKPDLHDVSHNDARSLHYLHDLCQFYFEHLFLAYCDYGDTQAKSEFGTFRPLLAELNSV